MLSHEFSVELLPEAGLRGRVRWCGILSAVAGLALIVQMPLSAVLRVALLLAWIARCGFELLQLSRGADRVARIGLNQLGQVWVIDGAGERQGVTLLRGSVVLAHHAWLRIRFTDGHKYAELVRGDAVKDRQWHRFQLIWKQARQTIGRAELS